MANDSDKPEGVITSPPATCWAKALGTILFLIAALPVLLAGCVAGWFSAAFMSGVRQGKKDWKEIDSE